MDWPVNTYDRYVNPSTGSDSNGGSNDTSDAWRTLAHAASASNTYCRIHLAAGTYTVSSGINYTNKRLQWIGPEYSGEPTAIVTGSGLGYYFGVRAPSGSNQFGGGVHNIMFDADGLTNGGYALILEQSCYYRVEDIKFKSASNFKYAYLLNPTSAGTATHNDASWIMMRNIEVENALLSYSGPTSACFNGWFMADINCHNDSPATHHIFYCDNCIKGLAIMRPTMHDTAANVSAIYIDENGTGKNRMVNIIDPDFENIGSPYYAVQLRETQTALRWDNPSVTTDGKIWGDSNVVGYMDVPSSIWVAGSLTVGEN